MSTKKCLNYCRVSSREQEETGYSLASQEKLLKEYSQNKGMVIKKTFIVSESASGQKQREVFEKMLVTLKKEKINIIVCEKVDRLTRNLRDAAKINEWVQENPEHEVHFAKESWVLTKDSKSNEKFVWNMRVSMSQYYTDNLSEEIRKGQKEKLAQGWLPARPPVGYITIGEDGRKVHILDPERAPLVRKMFELYSTGDYSLQRITDNLVAMGLRHRNGSKIVKSRIALMLANPFYCGKILWVGKVYEGKQEPLISQELYNSVQEVMRRKDAPKYSKRFYLFKRLIKCADCGGSITWQKHKSWVYGYCNGYKGCPKKSAVREDLIDQEIIDFLDSMRIKDSRLLTWAEKAIRYRQKSDKESTEVIKASLSKQVNIVKARFEKLYDDKIDEKITEELYLKKYEQYTEEKDYLMAKLAEIEGKQESDTEINLSLFQLSQKAKDIYIESKDDIERKRLLLQFVYQYIKLTQSRTLDTEKTLAFNLLVERIDKTNGSNIEIPADFDISKFEPSSFPLVETKKVPEGTSFDLVLGLRDTFGTINWNKVAEELRILEMQLYS